MKTKELTRRQAENFLRGFYGDVLNDGTHRGEVRVRALCTFMPISLQADWCAAWREMNTEGFKLMPYYLGDLEEHDPFSVSFLRLLSAHLFIRDTYM